MKLTPEQKLDDTDIRFTPETGIRVGTTEQWPGVFMWPCPECKVLLLHPLSHQKENGSFYCEKKKKSIVYCV